MLTMTVKSYPQHDRASFFGRLESTYIRPKWTLPDELGGLLQTDSGPTPIRTTRSEPDIDFVTFKVSNMPMNSLSQDPQAARSGSLDISVRLKAFISSR